MKCYLYMFDSPLSRALTSRCPYPLNLKSKGPESIVHSKVSDVSMTQSITSMVGVNTSVLITACVGLSR